MLGTACGDGGGVPPNTPPVANFTPAACVEDAACSFTDASTDDGTIAGWSWNFGDANALPADNVSTLEDPAHTYSVAGTYQVSLTVTDNAGESSTPTTKPVTVTAAAPGNTPPTAAFTFTCDGARVCTFNSSTSTDVDGTIATYAWNFGEPASGTANTSAEANPTHTYAAVTQATGFIVTLTVTDDDGAASVAATQTVTIQPPTSVVCSGVGPTADCTLDITEKATVTITLTSNNCELGGSRFDIISPIAQNIFFNGCLESQEGTVDVLNGPNLDKSFNAGTPILTRFRQGTAGAGDPVPGPPQITLDGTFPNWTMRIDDGGAPALPRNDDIVLTITATRVQ
jgi:PKD repeat protein